MANCKAFLATEVRIYMVNDHFYADVSFAKILERYSKYFGKLSIATRIINEKKVRNGYIQIDKYCSSFDNTGSLTSFLVKRLPQKLYKHLSDANIIILRLPSLMSLKLFRSIRKHSKMYMAEVMGCAWDAYWNHGVVGKMIAPYVFLKTRNMVRKADYCVYVTQSFLQNRYPRRNGGVGISNVDISCVALPRTYENFNTKKFSLMTAAALDVRHKGQEYVIKAMRVLKEEYDIDAVYYLAGKGDDARLKRIAEQNGVSSNVVFCGMLSREQLFKKMHEVDFYVQPSLQEGLPRSLIEAMSCGCVCFGSNTAGIPELLEPEQIFKRKSVDSIVDAFVKTISDGDLKDISRQNILKSKQYLSSKLDNERSRYYGKIVRKVKGRYV